MEKVVLAQKTNEAVTQYLKQYCEVVFCKEGDAEDLKCALRDAVAVLLGTWVKFSKDMIDAAPKLKVISRTGAGVDNVDIDYASQKGILVLSTPYENRVSVAEHAVAMICALSKQLVFLDGKTRGGDFGARRLNLPVDMDKKTLGLIGCGGIAREVAKKCSLAFNMDVIGYDPYLSVSPEGIVLCPDIEDVFRRADYISLHIPYTQGTKNLVDARLLGFMKPTAFLINTARGGIVNEIALYESLSNKRIAGAALDVFETEPLAAGSALAELENILLTPHTAALTKECSRRVALCAVRGIVDYLQGKEPAYIYNKTKV